MVRIRLHLITSAAIYTFALDLRPMLTNDLAKQYAPKSLPVYSTSERPLL